MTDLHDVLQRRSNRGRPRGAMAVLDAARGRGGHAPRSGPDRHRRVTAVLAVAVVVLLVAVAVLVANRDEPADQGPVDDGQIDTAPTPEVIEGPMLGAETGTTLIVSGEPGPRAIAIDLDGGTVRALDGVTPIFDSNTEWDEIGLVRDQMVFTSGGELWTVPTHLGGPPVAQGDQPLERGVGWNDLFTYFPSGATDRFWVTGGPIADRPERGFRAEERNLGGGVSTPAISLGRSGASLVGATSELVIVAVLSDGLSRIELRDRVTQEVVRTLPGFVDAVGERIVWAECQAGCPLHVLDVDTGDERQIDIDQTVDIGGAELSPDGSRLAVVGGGESPRLGSVDLATGDLWLSESPRVVSPSLDPVWSPDGRWVFAAVGGPGASSLVGARVGEAEATQVSIDGMAIWSLLAIPRVPGPPAGDVAACGPAMAGPCRPIVTSGPPQSTPTTEETVDTLAPDVTDETVPGVFDPRDISVVVANGSGVAGAATAVTADLAAFGFSLSDPTDTTAPVEETPLDTVYFASGYELAAIQVATALDLPPESVVELISPPVPAEALGSAEVLVVVGSSPGGLADSFTTSSTAIPP